MKKRCSKCNKVFYVERTKRASGIIIPKKEKKFCSRSCANSRTFTVEQNKRKGRSGPANKSWKGGRKRIKCRKCRKEIYETTTGYCYKCVKSVPSYKRNMSKALKGKTGGYRKGGGRGKGGYYKGKYFDSQFEIEMAKYFDKKKINWERNTKRFYIIFKGRKTYYIPDFYFPNRDRYLETKGFWISKDQEQKVNYAVRFHKLSWFLLMQKDWIRATTDKKKMDLLDL